MPLNKTTLKSTIKSLLIETRNNEEESAVDDIATGLADAIDAFVKSGTVTTTVTTTGSASAQAGTGTGSIS